MIKILPVTIMDWLVLIVMFSANIILIRETRRKRGTKSQSFYTCLLWTALDILIFVVIEKLESSSAMLVFIGVLFSSKMSLLLFKYDKDKKWTEDESKTSVVIVLVLFFWWLSNSNLLGLILAVIAEIVAGLPQMKKSWTNPGTRFTLISYLLFLAGYSLSILKLEKIEIKDILFPSAFFIYCVGDTYPLILKWWKISKRYKKLKEFKKQA